jgi:hypothetical protein
MSYKTVVLKKHINEGSVYNGRRFSGIVIRIIGKFALILIVN